MTEKLYLLISSPLFSWYKTIFQVFFNFNQSKLSKIWTSFLSIWCKRGLCNSFQLLCWPVCFHSWLSYTVWDIFLTLTSNFPLILVSNHFFNNRVQFSLYLLTPHGNFMDFFNFFSMIPNCNLFFFPIRLANNEPTCDTTKSGIVKQFE